MSKHDLITKDYVLFVVHYYASMQTWSKQDILAEIDRKIKESEPINPENLHPQGEWIVVDDGVNIGDETHMECSRCGKWNKDRQKTYFCPHCGAKMQ